MPTLVKAQAFPTKDSVLGSEGLPNGVDGLVEQPTSSVVVHPKSGKFSFDVTCTHPEDDPAPREVIEGGERLRRLQGVPIRRDPHHGQQAHATGVCGEEAKCGDCVIPGRGHVGRIVVVGNGDVVANADEPVPSRLRLASHRNQIVHRGIQFPLGTSGGAERLDRKLHTVGDVAG